MLRLVKFSVPIIKFEKSCHLLLARSFCSPTSLSAHFKWTFAPATRPAVIRGPTLSLIQILILILPIPRFCFCSCRCVFVPLKRHYSNRRLVSLLLCVSVSPVPSLSVGLTGGKESKQMSNSSSSSSECKLIEINELTSPFRRLWRVAFCSAHSLTRSLARRASHSRAGERDFATNIQDPSCVLTQMRLTHF